MSDATAGSIVGTGPSAGLSRRIAMALLRRLEHGTLTVVEGSRRTTFGRGGANGMHATVRVHDPAVWRAVVTRGSVGLGEAYFKGCWDSDDVVLMLRLLARNLDRFSRVAQGVSTLRNIAARPASLRLPSKSDDRRNIRAHYDLGNEFFELFLDSTMAYSCGVYESEASTLEEASTAKFERICRKLNLGPNDNVIEIGGGWGGFALHAASRHGCRVTTTTISERQFDYATAAIARAGLTDRVTVLSQDYRDLEGQFSHLVSIEMIEAVDWRLHDTFFAMCAQLLRPDGRAALQCIVIDDREYEGARNRKDFIKEYIFPGGCLPSITAIANSTTRASDLRLIDHEDIGPHYARTLSDWRHRLEGRRSEAMAMGFDEQFLRMWRFYFASCEAVFLERRVSDVQMIFARSGWRGELGLRGA
ncbi:MAG: cyclopropane-fatty-acyl-phospholipid synthase family protein [Candidatus Dormibacteria bacterium]|jgi:cyclopropane-fatty-acyl-phospholipid synthase